MENMESINKFRELMAEFSQNIEIPAIQPSRIDAFINPADLVPAVKKLHDSDWGYLITISAYDTVDDQGTPQIGLVYHFGEREIIGSIRFFLPYDQLTIESICPVIPSATLYERECMELYGIDIIDTPDRSRLLIPDDWPEDVFPMRKSFISLDQSQPAENGENHD